MIISLHPQYLVEARHRLNHVAMHAGSDGVDYYERLASLLWTGRAAAKNIENFQRMNMRLGSVVTNHFPGVDDMCAKNYLAKKLKLMDRLYPGEYSFVPRTWILPQEWETFRADVIAGITAAQGDKAAAAAAAAASSATVAATSATATPAAASPTPTISGSTPSVASTSSTIPSHSFSSSTSSSNLPTYLFKPSNGSQGSGIMLAQRLADMERIYRTTCLEEGIPLTVQEYISKPLLLGGLKFDFRIYCLLSSLSPLRMHLYKDGLARFCTEEYSEPNAKNLKLTYMHLTNSSLNKGNEEKFKIQTTADLTEAERMALNRELIAQSQGASSTDPNSMQSTKLDTNRPVSTHPSVSPSPSSSTASKVDSTSSASSSVSTSNPLSSSSVPSFSSSSLASSSSSSTSASASTSGGQLPEGFLPADFSLGFELKEEEQSKRSIRTVLQQLRQEQQANNNNRPNGTNHRKEVSDKAFWSSIANIVSKTIISLWPPLIANYKVAFPVHRPSESFPSTCFHILGFDILLDADMKPWLLELNCSPSLNIESTLDLVLKKGMLEQAFGILGYLGDQSNAAAKRRRAAQEEATTTPNENTTKQLDSGQSSPKSASATLVPPSSSSQTSSTRPASDANLSVQLPRPSSASSSTRRSSGSSSPFTQPPSANSIANGTRSNTSSNRASPLTIGSPSPTPSISPLPTYPLTPNPSSLSPSPSTFLPHPPAHVLVPPVIPFSHRRAMSTGVPLTGVKYIVLPSGNIQVQELPRLPSVASTTPTLPSSSSNTSSNSESTSNPASSVASAASAPHPLAPLLPADQEAAEYMEICPEEDWARDNPGSTGFNPLLLFQHPKLLAIFDRYTSGSSVKKLSSNKFMQACVASRLAVSGKGSNVSSVSTSNSTPSSSSSTTPSSIASSHPTLKPISHWPTRPDIDLLFMQHTKFESSTGSIAGAGSGKMLDYAGFCDILVQVAETKYKQYLQPSSSSSSIAPPTLTLIDACRHLIDSLVLPDDKVAVGSANSSPSDSSLNEREQAAKLAQAALAMSVTGSLPNSAFLPPAIPKRTPPSTSHANSATRTSIEKSRNSTLTSAAAVAPTISAAALSATLSSILAPKPSSNSVFHRLTGTANANTPPTAESLKKKKRREKELQAGSYEAFIAAHQAAAASRKSKTNKK